MWFYHYTQSFSPDEPVTSRQAHKVAKEFAEQAWPDSQILVATHVDARHIADTCGSADNLGSDLAYLAGDLATVIDENYRPQDSTTMRQPRRRKRTPGQKPGDHDYEQKM